MSDAIGPIAVTDGRQDGAAAARRGARLRRRPSSSSTRRSAGSSTSAEHEVVDLLERERDRLDALAHALLERETLDQPEAYEVAGVAAPDLDVQDEAHATTIAPGATDLSVAGGDEAPTA